MRSIVLAKNGDVVTLVMRRHLFRYQLVIETKSTKGFVKLASGSKNKIAGELKTTLLRFMGAGFEQPTLSSVQAGA